MARTSLCEVLKTSCDFRDLRLSFFFEKGALVKLLRSIGGWAAALLLLTASVRPVPAAAPPSNGNPSNVPEARAVDPQSNEGASKTALDALPAARAGFGGPLS